MVRIDPPAAPGAFAPRQTMAADGLALSWLEPVGSPESPGGHRIRFARFADDRWSEPRTVVEASDLFANWADVPSVVPLGGGAHVAHWLIRVSDAPFAYTIRAAFSTDRGDSWLDAGIVPADDSATEHGFVDLVPDTGRVRAFWLDGREMVDGGPMTLRTRLLTDPRSGPSRSAEAMSAGTEEILDPRVCECCPLDAAATDDGPLVVYRGRGYDETRDIRLVRRTVEGWSDPIAVHADGWKIPGCPVNGPAVAADGRRVAVAWFTAPGELPAVRLAISADGGASFALPIEIDGDAPVGRVDVVLAGDDAIVSWLAKSGERAELRLLRVSLSGAVGVPVTLARIRPSRRAGFPRLSHHAGRLFASWVEVDEQGGSRLRAVQLDAREVPRG